MIVVGLALLRDGLLLAAQRSEPEAMRGLWEFPGGKVEPGESEQDALVREISEELGVDVRVGDFVGEVRVIDGTIPLRIYLGELVDPTHEPVAVEHLALRWVSRHDISGLEWIPADLPIVQQLVASGVLA